MHKVIPAGKHYLLGSLIFAFWAVAQSGLVVHNAQADDPLSESEKTAEIAESQIPVCYSRLIFSGGQISMYEPLQWRKVDSWEYQIEEDPSKVADKLKEASVAAQKGIDKQPKYLTKKPFSMAAEMTWQPRKNRYGDITPNEITVSSEPLLPHVGIATYVGDRIDVNKESKGMEDAHIAQTFSFKFKAPEENSAAEKAYEVQITGIFDGHDGAQFAQFASQQIVVYLKARLEEYCCCFGFSNLAVWNALTIAMVDLSRSGIAQQTKGGTTANVALMIEGDLWVANVGDSRAMLLDGQGNPTQLSEDADPRDEKYQQDIAKYAEALGMGSMGRIEGNQVKCYGQDLNRRSLSMTRALGDHSTFCGLISARPTIVKYARPTEGWHGYYLIQTCDGPFEVITSRQFAELAHNRMQQSASVAKVAKTLVQNAYMAGSEDNLSVMVTAMEQSMKVSTKCQIK